MRCGADPEVFLQDKQGNFKAICGMLDGHDKWNPYQVPDMPNGFTFQEDNVSLEFGVPPAASVEEFKAHIKAVQQRFLQEYKHLSFSNLSAVVFPDSEMTHPMAHIFGCEPDFNAWTGSINKKPKPPVPNLRSAGGHVHIETTLDVRKVIQACDLTLGVPSILMDKGELRKKLYGKAGAYRPKSYGGEYRVLSNFWIFEDKHVEWVWRGVAYALDLVKNNTDFMSLKKDITSTINTSNKKNAELLIKTFDLEVV